MISICIPLYNKEKYIRRCIDSILNQTYKDFEIIIVDDCSTDNSINLIPKDDRIKIYYNDRNIGCGANRLKTIQLATGDYYCFIDADDWIEQDYLQNLYNAIQDCDIVITGHNINKLTDKYETITILNKHLQNYTSWGKLYTKDIVHSHKYSTMRYAEDLMTIPHWIMNANKIKFIDYNGYHYAINETSIVKDNNSINFTNAIEASYNMALLYINDDKLIKEGIYRLYSIRENYNIIIIQNDNIDAINFKLMNIIYKTNNAINFIEKNLKVCLNKQII